MILNSLTGNSIAYCDASTQSGSVSGSVFLDQLSCSGTESVLLDCQGRLLDLAECNIYLSALCYCLCSVSTEEGPWTGMYQSSTICEVLYSSSITLAIVYHSISLLC